MNSSQNANGGNYQFYTKETESSGGAFTGNLSHPSMAGFYHGNEGVQEGNSTLKKQPGTRCGDRKLLAHMEPDQVPSMESHQPPSIVGRGNCSTIDHSKNRHASYLSHDPFMNNGMGAPPWSMGLGETVRLPSDLQVAPFVLPPTATSRLLDDRSVSQSLGYLDPNPIFVPPAASLCHDTSQSSGHVGSAVDTASSTLNHGAPPDQLSFTGMRNDFAAVELSPDERFSGIDYGHQQRYWGTQLRDFSPHCHPGAPKPSQDSWQLPPRHVNDAQLGYVMGPAITLPLLHHPILNHDIPQPSSQSFASVDHQTLTNPIVRCANVVTGVPNGAPMIAAPHVNIQHMVHVQQVAHINLQPVAQFQRSPNAMSIIVVDQGTASQATNIPFLATEFGMPTLQPGSSHEEGGRQQIIAATDDQISSHCLSPQGIPMSLQCDETKLSAYQTLIRQQLEFFVADSEDIQSGGQGRKKTLSLRQVGIRCIHCRHLPWSRRGQAAVYFPSTLEGVYQAAQNMAANHLCGSCHCIPVTLQENLCSLRKETRPRSVRNGKLYWAEACRVLGLVQTTKNGLRLKRTGNQRKQTQRKDVLVANTKTKRG